MSPRSTTPPPSLRDAVLDVARRRFLADGMAGLAVRGIAEDAGCTTMAVYTHFGGKDGLIATFFDEGFARLAEAQRAVPEALPPAQRALAMCHAYRGIARDFPHHYDLMLGARSAEFTPPPVSRVAAMRTIETLVDVLLPLQAKTKDRRRRAEEHAHAVIAFCHGWVTLERSGLIPPGESTDKAFERGALAVIGQ